MENASKALIMAGGVLIAILLLTLFSYLFGQMASSTSSIYKTLEKHEIDEFNQQFLNYEGRKLTAQDVATLMNLAENAEKNSKFNAKVKISLNGGPIPQNSSDWLNKHINSNDEYKCEKVNTNSSTLLVESVEIKKK